MRLNTLRAGLLAATFASSILLRPMGLLAMFDELNEGTAILKCTDHPPVGRSEFVGMEGMPSDHYLWLTGQGGRLLRREIEVTGTPPSRQLHPAETVR
jgi:hypothetical protein